MATKQKAGSSGSPEPPFRKAGYETLAAFRYTLRRFLRFSESAAETVGLTPQKYLALLAIQGFPGRDYVAVSELAEQLQIRDHSAVELVDRMEAQCLVARRPSAEDRRMVYVTTTSEGKEMLKKLAAEHREQLRRLGPQLRLLLRAVEESD